MPIDQKVVAFKPLRVVTAKLATHCFWCQNKQKITVDHLISKPLAKYLRIGGAKFDRNREVVPACPACNGERAEISGLFGRILKIEKSLGHMSGFDTQRADKYKPIMVQQYRLRHIIERYQRLVPTLLRGDVVLWCQIELDMVSRPEYAIYWL